MRTVEEVISDISRLVQDIYDIGKVDGVAKLRAEMAAVLSPYASESPVGGSSAPVGNGRGPPASENKAPMGTVKPGILSLIERTPDGLTQDDIIKLTGFKSNSVRGTLYSLLTDNLVRREGGRYFPPRGAMPAIASESANSAPWGKPSG